MAPAIATETESVPPAGVGAAPVDAGEFPQRRSDGEGFIFPTFNVLAKWRLSPLESLWTGKAK